MKPSGISCKCGAHSATDAALNAMQSKEQAELKRKILNCITCQRDIRERGGSVISQRQIQGR